MKDRIGIFFGGVSDEYEISLMSAGTVLRAIDRNQHEVVMIGITREGAFVHFTGDVSEIEQDTWQTHGEEIRVSDLGDMIDFGFPVIHGRYGEDGSIQSLLELLGIPYVGSDALVCRRAQNKDSLHATMEAYRELTDEPAVASWPQGICIARDAFKDMGAATALDLVEERVHGGYPVAVKPAHGGSAMGVHRVDDIDHLGEAILDALSYDDHVVIEQWIEGVELAVSVIGTGWDAHALPPVEIVPKRGLYDTAARMDASLVDYYAPVRNESLSSNEADAQAIRAEIERAVLEVYRAYGLRDLGRIDLIWDGAQARVMETNVSPGMTETSLFPAACKAGGLSLSAVLNELVSNAKERGAVFC